MQKSFNIKDDSAVRKNIQVIINLTNNVREQKKLE